MDHGFSTTDARDLHDLFLDAYLLGDVDARLALDAFTADAPPEYVYEAVPMARFTGPLSGPLDAKPGRTIPVIFETFGPVGDLVAQVVGPGGATVALPLTYDADAGTNEALLRTKGLARGVHTVTVATHFGTYTASFTIR
jgi:hypothetical protein